MSSSNIPNVMKQGKWTPWFYLLPALIIMSVFIVYPMINTIGLSFKNTDSTESAADTCIQGKSCWGVFENYHYALTSELDLRNFSSFWQSFWTSSFGNTLKWILLMVSGTVGLGLIFAVLFDRIKYERLSKAIIFMPMAISFVGAGVIWGFVYDFGTKQVQIGILNAIVQALGGAPISWMSTPQLNSLCLIVVGIWIWTGFCMTILSASLKAVPEEIIEAARVDGATEWKIFWRVLVPIISPTIVVVITTMVINVLKLFDIVYVMTGGNFGTEVIANRMYNEMYKSFNTGRGTAIAVVLIVMIIPFMYVNVKRFLAQEAMR